MDETNFNMSDSRSSLASSRSTPSRTSSTKSARSRLSEKALAKAERISAACDLGDKDALVELATSEGGLLLDELRQEACKVILLPSLLCCL